MNLIASQVPFRRLSALFLAAYLLQCILLAEDISFRLHTRDPIPKDSVGTSHVAHNLVQTASECTCLKELMLCARSFQLRTTVTV